MPNHVDELHDDRAPTLAQSGEFGAIARWASLLSAGPSVRLGIGDDAAILEPLRAPAVTCDALVEGVHFRLDWTSPRDLGWKTLAVSLSDLAAMGARPSAAFLSLAAPSSLPLSWLDAFFAGLDECARAFGCPLAGGDTTRSPGPLLLSLSAVGEAQVFARHPTPITRSGARAGDVLIVTGTLGDSRAGLRLLEGGHAPGADEASDFVLGRHFRPTPRLREISRVLEAVPSAVTAALDLSDGLVGDAAHIARASGLTLRFDYDALPLSPQLMQVAQHRGWDARQEALRGGEDYELLLCVRPESAPQVLEAIASCGTRATLIGSAQAQVDGPVVVLRRDGSRVTDQGSWAHF
jgi:thiamine-monophosphate kinase